MRIPEALAVLAEAVADETGLMPNVDFALLALVLPHDLPPDTPLRLFATSRSDGWLTLEIEQVCEGRPIRPHAPYVGPKLEEAPS